MAQDELTEFAMEECHKFDGRMILECPCGHRWLEKVKLPMRVDAFIARARGFRVCPVCGNNKKIMMLIGDKFREALKELEKSSV